MRLADVGLNDKYDLEKSTILVTGTQAVLRAMLMQHARDASAGVRTAGYISGYRGSPLGALDLQFGRAKELLDAHDIVFNPGLNEDLAATALWGAQQAEMRGEGTHDGVFGIWYGKGPGVDRSGDAFRHANLAGTSAHGGVLALMGDDHTCESSTTAHQSEFALVDAMIPILNPAGVQELIDYALTGWALSRYAGCWVGLKCVKDTIESTAVIDASPDRININLPDDFLPPEDGLNIRPSDPPLEQERRLHRYKLDAARAFARANNIDQVIFRGGPAPKLGIVTSGKSYLDVRQALDELGIDEAAAAKLGLALYKVGMTWPLEPEGIKRFAKSLENLIVIEEKRGLMEEQIKSILYGLVPAPRVSGKKAEDDTDLFPSHGALDTNHIALEIGRRVFAGRRGKAYGNRLNDIEAVQAAAQGLEPIAVRRPYFCAGCPHNSSTVLPDGARGYAGIGCHWMVQFIDRRTEGYTQMGGEGANWIGEAPFSQRKHIFQNLGDGTYNHSGSLAIRAARAAGINITFKILYNDAVAMTGGQAHEGDLSVADIARQVSAEDVGRVSIVSEQPDFYRNVRLPGGIEVFHRDRLGEVQKDFGEIEGVSVLIYDQTCAAEKRRRRKRGTYPDPDKRVFINELVCEGCGDCGAVSNCLAIAPSDTIFGRKRQIDQSSCNKDFSCLKGFCPSFVTVNGALKSGSGKTGVVGEVDEPVLPVPDVWDPATPFSAVIAGIGGTGIVTIAALLGMAAHLENKACGIIDMAGLAQKGGAVVSHIRIARAAEDIQAIRVAAGGADLVLGCDLVVAGSPGVLATMLPGKTRAAINTAKVMPSDFTQNREFELPDQALLSAISQKTGPNERVFVDAARIADALIGDTIAANIFLLGVAYQNGFLPLGAEAIERAVALNGVAIERNISAFRWGRQFAFRPDHVREQAGLKTDAVEPQPARSIDELVEIFALELAAYQDDAYAAGFRSLVARTVAKEKAFKSAEHPLAEAVARSYFKLLAYKDEYEVARLYADGRFARAVAGKFEPGARLQFHLSPPVFARMDPSTGRPRKYRFGPWMMPAFKLLAGLRFLRGGFWDPFSRAPERVMERELIGGFEDMVEQVLDGLDRDNHALAVQIVSSAQRITGYGPVKSAAAKAVGEEQAGLLKIFRQKAETPLEVA